MTTTSNEFEEKVANMADQAEAEGLKEHKAMVERAALVQSTLETEGGKEIVKQINDMRELLAYPPENFFTSSPDGAAQQVDTTLVARVAGGREILQGLLDWFAACKEVLEREAKKNG